MSLRHVQKWRIKKRPEYAWRWVIFAPGFALEAAYIGGSFADCVASLPVVQRVRREGI